MTPTPHPPMPARLRELFAAAVELPPAERERFVAAGCGDDGPLAAELRQLLSAADAAPAFLERPAADVEIEGWSAGPWRIGSLLAAGGMGDVHEATRADAELPWTAAIKVLRRGQDGAALERRFRAERRTLASLAHPNIVALIDAGALPDGRPYLVMERVDGAPLLRHCEERGLPLAARLELLLAVAGALEHAHRRLVVHCDLKPANVLVTRDGIPKLLDFGVAQLMDESIESIEIVEGAVSGGATADAGFAAPRFTLGYASPELMEGRAVGVASDVFSLGVLLAELATGRRLFAERGRSPDAVAAAVQSGVRELGPLIDGRAAPRDLVAIVARATAPDPAARYGSVELLAQDVRSFLEGRPIAARAAGLGDRVGKLVRRNRLASSALLLAAVALSFAARSAWRDWSRARAEAGAGWQAHAQAVAVARFLEEVTRDAGAQSPAALGAALDRALARVGTLDSAPEAEGRLRLAFGALLLEQGRRDEAIPQLERARTLITTQRGFGREDRERVDGLLARARDEPGSR